MKIHPVGAELFHADRRTDRLDEDKSRFPQFCESTPQTWQEALRGSQIYHIKRVPSHGTSVTAGVLRGATKETRQCIIAPEVIFVPSAYDINRSCLLHYRMKGAADKKGKPEDSDDYFSDGDESCSLNSNG